MPHSRNDLRHQIFGADAQAGGVDAGVTAEGVAVQQILIDQQPHPHIFVVHQTQYA